MAAEPNGIHQFNQRFDKVDRELVELKDDLASAIRELSGSIEKQALATTALTTTVTNLTLQFSAFLQVASNSIPIKAVGWMFFIILVFVIILLVGIEGVKSLPKFGAFFL